MIEEFKSRIHQYLISETDFLKVKDKLSEDELRMYVAKTIDDVCREHIACRSLKNSSGRLSASGRLDR